MILNNKVSCQGFPTGEYPQEDIGLCRRPISKISNHSRDSFQVDGDKGFILFDAQDKDHSPFLPLNSSPSSLTSVECSPTQPTKDVLGSTEFLVPKFHAQSEFLDFIDPAPAYPPQYRDITPGGCPRFPIFGAECGKEDLPPYSPAAYKVGACSRKLEWLSPYEVSPTRTWKNVVIELNSTQLNVYSMPNQLDSTLSSIKSNEINQLRPVGSISETHLNSIVTTELDMEVRRVCDKLKLFELAIPLTLEQLAFYDQTNGGFSLVVAHKVLKACKQKKLLRSYSLQYAKIGLATDYTKKPNVLRLRLENEQFLLCFSSTQELIDWNLALSIGKDVSLDLTEREIPKYRTVPRRRSQIHGQNTPFFNDVVTRRMRSRSEPLVENSSSTRLKERFSRFKTRIVAPAALNSKSIKAIKVPQERSKLRKPSSMASIVTHHNCDQYRKRSLSNANSATFTISSEDEFLNGESDMPHERDSEDIEGYIQNMSDTRGSDEDDEIENDFDEFLGLRFTDEPSGGRDTTGDEKWAPTVKFESQRQYLRNCVKCIRPLGFDDSWVNKPLVKPTTMTPLTTMYVRTQYQMRDSSFSSLSDLGDELCPSKIRRKEGGQRALLDLPDTSLARIPHHNLKGYSVGQHSLIPKVL